VPQGIEHAVAERAADGDALPRRLLDGRIQDRRRGAKRVRSQQCPEDLLRGRLVGELRQVELQGMARPGTPRIHYPQRAAVAAERPPRVCRDAVEHRRPPRAIERIVPGQNDDRQEMRTRPCCNDAPRRVVNPICQVEAEQPQQWDDRHVADSAHAGCGPEHLLATQAPRLQVRGKARRG
jgi:hypothetical protein